MAYPFGSESKRTVERELGFGGDKLLLIGTCDPQRGGGGGVGGTGAVHGPVPRHARGGVQAQETPKHVQVAQAASGSWAAA